MRRSMLLPLVLGLAAAALTASREARAGIVAGIELDGGHGFELPSGTRAGYGFAGALGYRIGLGPVFLQPEAQGGYMVFPSDAGPAIHIPRILGGARFGLSGRVQPALFAHAGAGWLGVYTSGRAVDGGVALAFKLIPVLTFGGQAAYNLVSVPGAASATKWLSYGAHVAVEF
jgi:hypothetical protein